MDTRDWYSWVNLMPPPPDDFHVTGEVLVGNPGVQAELVPRVPQGIKPAILLLDLHLVQRPGMWPQVMTWVQARYDRVLLPGAIRYTDVEVFDGGSPIAKMPVDVVS
jgi:hypothetical protein